MVADPLRSRSRRKLRRKLSGSSLEKLLKDPKVLESWGAANVADEKRRVARARRNVERDTPSIVWFEDVWERKEPFPPGGDVTLMRRCPRCDRYTPPNNFGSSGDCDDCRFGSMSPMQLEALPSSPGCVVDFRGLKGARKRREP